ncbi:MAG: hypothetical protein IKU26_06215 [Clostridia bacterium]|nr:hypothetical protein [Clostridia bacterium]
MEKALPWIIGFLALLVIWACVEVGWLYSILTIGIVCGVLYVMYILHKKASHQDANEHDKQLANISRKLVIGISACLILVGAVLGAVGLANPDTEYMANAEICAWCEGKGCSGCDGWGFFAFDETTYSNYTFLGILMAASGAVLYIGMAVMKNTIDSTTKTTGKNTENINATISATPKPISPNNVQHDNIPQAHTVYMLIDEVTPNPEHPERLFEIKGNVVRGNIYGQQVVILKSHITGETAKFKVAGQGLKGKAGNRVRLNIYGTEGGKLNVTIGDSLYL